MLLFRALGPLVVEDDGVERALGGHRQRCVLAVLLTNANQVVSADRLIDQLWGDDAPPTALATLHAYVSHLRRILEPDRAPRSAAAVLVSRAGGYVLQVPRDRFDVAQFEDLLAEAQACRHQRPRQCVELLEEALGLWRGGAYEEFSYEPFAGMEITRLHELRIAAHETRIEVELDLGSDRQLVPELEMLVAQHPFRERLRAQLMLALYRSGRHGDALAVFQDLRTALADELGLDPSRELQELEAAVLAQDPRLDHVPPPSSVDLAPDDLPVRPSGTTPRLVGRESELRRLREATRAARDGHGCCVLVEGEAGIGKSRLLSESLSEAAATGMRVMAGRCLEGAGAPPFWPWIQILRSAVADLGQGLVAEAAGPHRGDLAVVLPELATPGDIAVSDPEHRRFGGAAAVVEVLTRLSSDEPLVVAVDDAHVADVDSLRVLVLLAQRAPTASIAVVTTLRPWPAGDTARSAAMAELVRLEGVERMALAPLVRRDVDALLDEVINGPLPATVADTVFTRTAGNPFFVVELARLLDDARARAVDHDAIASFAVPAAVSDVLRRRVAALSPEAQRLVAAAAVVGREFDVDVVAEAARVTPLTALELLDEAATHDLVSGADAPGRAQFTHVLVADTVLDSLTDFRRASLHRAVADALERRHGDDPLRFAAIAHHVEEAGPFGDPAWAVPLVRRSAQLAAAALSFSEAERLHRVQLDLARSMPRGDARTRAELEALVDLAVILTWTRGYHSAEVGGVVEEALRVGAAGGAIVSLVAALYARWSHHCLRAEFAEADAIAAELQTHAMRHDEPAVAFVAGLTRAVGLWRQGRLGQAVAAFEDMEHLIVRVGDVALTRVVLVAPPVIYASFCGLCNVMAGDLVHGLRRAEQAVDHARAIAHEWSLAYALVFGQAFAAAAANDAELAARAAAEGMRRSEEHGFTNLVPLATVVRGWADAVTDRRAPDASAIAAADALASMGALALRPFLLGLIADAHLAASDHARALVLVDTALEEVDRIDERFWQAELHCIRACALAGLGAADEAAAALAEAEAVAVEQGVTLASGRAEAARRATSAGDGRHQRGGRAVPVATVRPVPAPSSARLPGVP